MTRERRKRKASEKQAGQGFVEFALILPVLLLLMFGVIEFGRLLFIYTEVSNAAREAVRFGVVLGPGDDPNYEKCGIHYDGTCPICDAGNGATVLTGLDDSNFTIILDDGEGGNPRNCDDLGYSPSDEDIDRLVVTVTYDVRPLVLFQNAGPFQVQFTAARTLVYQGIAMSGFDDVAAGNPHLSPPEGLEYRPDSKYPGGCLGRFTWTAFVDPATVAYRLWKWYPSPPYEIGETVINWYPAEDAEPIWVDHGEVYYVQAYDLDGGGYDPSVDRNYAVAECVSQPQDFRFVPKKDCEGHLEWTEVIGAAEYHLYGPSPGISQTVEAPRYPKTTEDFISGVYTVTAVNLGGQEGIPSIPVTISWCNPLEAPSLDDPPAIQRTWPPCQVTLNWDSMADALGYRVYGGSPLKVIADVTDGTSYDLGDDVTDGDGYSVLAYNNAGDGPFSSVATVSGCGVADVVPMGFNLHTSWLLGDCEVHDGNPPLPMDGVAPPTCLLEDSYNGTGSPAGRQVGPDGTIGATDLEYLAWHSAPVPDQLVVSEDVTVRFWYSDTVPMALSATLGLCRYSDSGGYSDCVFSAPELLVEGTGNWSSIVANWPVGTPLAVATGERLAVSLVHNGGSDNSAVWFMYDLFQYPSWVTFEGQWGP